MHELPGGWQMMFFRPPTVWLISQQGVSVFALEEQKAMDGFQTGFFKV